MQRIGPETDRSGAAMLDLLSTGVALVAPDGTITFVNRAWAGLFELGAAECVGKAAWNVLPQLQSTNADGAPLATLHDGVPRNVHIPLRHGLYEIRSSRDAAGMLVLEVLREVSDRSDQARELAERSAEANALRRLARAMAEEKDFGELLNLLSEDALRQTGADGSAVVKIHDREGEVVATAGSTNVLRGTRFPLEGSLTSVAIGQRAMVSDSSHDRQFPRHQQFAATQRAGPVLITPLVAHEHVLGVLSVSKVPGSSDFTTRDRERLQAIADHTSLGLWKLQLLDEARAAGKAKSDFMATMSHELRTPLTALTGYGELLSEEIVGPLSAQQADVIDRMRSVTHHLGVVIDEILTFSNLEAGREIVRMAPVNMPALIRSAVAVVEPIARQKGIAFSTEVADALDLVSDADKVRQILVNLVGNAIKFTDTGAVTLVVGAKADRVAFRVTDTGIGIRAADRVRLFQPFSQLDSGLTRRHGGTGLGLFICRRLAALLGGTIELESEFGKGSVFTLILPQRPPR